MRDTLERKKRYEKKEGTNIYVFKERDCTRGFYIFFPGQQTSKIPYYLSLRYKCLLASLTVLLSYAYDFLCHLLSSKSSYSLFTVKQVNGMPTMLSHHLADLFTQAQMLATFSVVAFLLMINTHCQNFCNDILMFKFYM